MFFKHKAEAKAVPRDIWGRAPLSLYEKVGRPIERNKKELLRTVNGKKIQDYLVLFYKGKPDIRGVGGLLYIGEWTNYGSKIYRVNTLISAEKLAVLISEELQLTKKDFLISETKLDPRMI